VNYTSFTVDYSNRSSCLVFIRDSLEPWGIVPPADTEVKLEVESGKDLDGVRVYRPYKRLASLLARAKNTKHVNAGKDGAKFRDADKTVATWLIEQGELDAALSLTLPIAPQSPTRRSSFSKIIPSF
jgi:hypothetical protein